MAKILLIISIALMFLFTGCALSGNSTPKYFEGYNGVNMRIADAPDKVYYYSRPFQPDVDNTFMFNLEVHNQGSADSYGGIYVSGYDPNFIKMTGISVGKLDSWADCEYDASWLDGNWLANIVCNIMGSDIYTTVGDGPFFKTVGGDIKAGEILRKIADGSDSKVMDSMADMFRDTNIQFMVDLETGNKRVGIDWSNSQFDLSGAYNGRLAMAFITSIYAELKKGGTFINPTHGKEFLLMGNKPTFPGGEMTYTSFTGKVDSWPRGMELTEQRFLFTSCYVYTTYANPQVCIDPFPDSNDRKVCTPEAVTYPGGQGAPVAITKVEQENTPREIIFTIHVQNKGKGLIFSPMSLHKCDPLVAERVTQIDMNYVFLGDIRLANEYLQFRCTPASRMIRLDDRGKGQIVCTYPLQYNMRSAYPSPLILSFWYGYSETLQKSVVFRRGN